MKYTCPHCHSYRIISRNYGRKTCSTIGTVAGAHIAVRSIQAGVMAGRFLGPPGMLVGGAAGLVFAGISGAMLGGTTGAKLGSMLDNNVLNNYQCLDCKKAFSEPSTDLDSDDFFYVNEDDEDRDSLPSIRN